MGPRPPYMDFKRLLKGPWLWIVLTVFLVLTVLQFASSNDGYQEVDTATMVTNFDNDKVKDVTFVEGDQQILSLIHI